MSERAWILLPSGNQLNLLDPDPWAWTDDDLAIGLSRTYRWAGYSAWDLPLSVAQHSLAVLALRRSLFAERPLPVADARRELLHDATEALMGGWDPITPLKPHLGPGFSALVARLQAAVDQRYDLPAWTPADHALHKQADRLAAANEAYHVVGWSRAAMREQLGIELAPLEMIRSICRRISGHGNRGRPSWPRRASFASCRRLLPTKAGECRRSPRERGTDMDPISALIGLTESGRSLKG